MFNLEKFFEAASKALKLVGEDGKIPRHITAARAKFKRNHNYAGTYETTDGSGKIHRVPIWRHNGHDMLAERRKSVHHT